MHEKKMYKQLVFYLEACESGSMFSEILPTDINVFALSASSPSESSWAQYCGEAANVNGTNIGSCLGDEFSVNWMEDSDAAVEKENIKAQFTAVHEKTHGSQVMDWGDKTVEEEPVTDFQGTTDSEEAPEFSRMFKKFTNKLFGAKKTKKSVYSDLAKTSRIPSRDVKLDFLTR